MIIKNDKDKVMLCRLCVKKVFITCENAVKITTKIAQIGQ